jgi:hypothetical protein
MAWADVRYPYLQAAMLIISDAGIDVARARCNARLNLERATEGFKSGKTYVWHNQHGRFEQRVLLAYAHWLQFPDATPLGPKDFAGRNQGAIAKNFLMRISKRFTLQDPALTSP